MGHPCPLFVTFETSSYYSNVRRMHNNISNKYSYHGSWYLILGYIMSFFLCKILLRTWLRNRNLSKCAIRMCPIIGCCNLRLYSWLRHKSCAVMQFMARIFLNVNENKIWLKLKCRKLDDMKCCNADKQELTIACFVGLVHWSIFFSVKFVSCIFWMCLLEDVEESFVQIWSPWLSYILKKAYLFTRRMILESKQKDRNGQEYQEYEKRILQSINHCFLILIQYVQTSTIKPPPLLERPH